MTDPDYAGAAPGDSPDLDPEAPITVDREDLVEREADVVDELARPMRDDADEADVADQRRAVPDGEEDYAD